MLGEPSEGSDDYRMGVSRLAMTARTPSRVASTPVPQRDNHYVTIDMDGLGRQSPNTTFGREAQTQHEIDARMERMFTSMTDAFVTALSRVATPPAVHQRSLPLPEFRGMEHEIAQDFLYRMEDHFHKLHVTDTSIKLALSCEQLKDQAKVWYEPYRYLITTYEAFAERLYERYDAVENLTQATTKLYGERQKPGESAAVFITRKMCLFNRVAREQPEEMRIAIVLDLLEPELCSRIRCHPFRSLEHLVTLASKVEADIKRASPRHAARNTERPPTDSQHRPRRAPEGNRASPVMTDDARQHGPRRNVPSTPCRYCPGAQFHFHNECGNNPHRNRGPPPERGNNFNRQQANNQGSWQNRDPRNNNQAGNSGPPHHNRSQYNRPGENRPGQTGNPPSSGSYQGNRERAAGTTNGNAPAQNQ